jgi:deoxyribodipyrimidine photo-lyase
MPYFNASLVWFRRDLRLLDHAALYHALAGSRRVHCVFVFDRTILDRLEERADRRVEFILKSVIELDCELAKHGGGLIVRHGDPVEVIPRLASELGVDTVFANRDYEPAAILRDRRVESALADNRIRFESFKDQVVFDTSEIMTGEGRPYSVFTPYKNTWLKTLEPAMLEPYPVAKLVSAFAPRPDGVMPTLADLGFLPSNLDTLAIPTGSSGADKLLEEFSQRIARYHETRDFPAVKGPSYLSMHLRFGTVSIRRLAALAVKTGGDGGKTWLAELIWREFYQMILFQHPHVVDRAFKAEFDALEFDNDPSLFAAWCDARTGYPLVDAAMRQINQTGYMHNRLRMIAASFLVKDLLIDWRWGERFFAARLNDFDLAANNGGWQWAASTGCDAQPYFRIFNPVTQSERFDPQGKFIRRYVPELARIPEKFIHSPWRMPLAEQEACSTVIGRDYPAPIVDHDAARVRALARFQKAARTRD